MSSISVPCRQGRIALSDPLPRLPNPDAWGWPYGWVHFLGSPVVDGNGKLIVTSMTRTRPELIDVNDGTQLVAQFTQSGKVVLFTRVFEYVCLYSNCVDARRSVLSIKICGVEFYVRSSHLF